MDRYEKVIIGLSAPDISRIHGTDGPEGTAARIVHIHDHFPLTRMRVRRCLAHATERTADGQRGSAFGLPVMAGRP